MIAAAINDSVAITNPVADGSAAGSNTKNSGQMQAVDFAKCDCCGLTEECTLSYIQTIRERYGGKWICGLCAEAVKDERRRCRKLISADEAMARHLSFCGEFKASSRPPEDSTGHLIRAMRHVVKKGLIRSTPIRSMTGGGTVKLPGSLLGPSESCSQGLMLAGGPAAN